jgi:glycine/D-amino acid oxidase-like deaminating enzyme
MDRYGVAVIGLGAFGSCSAYWRARRGVVIVEIEQFELGHVLIETFRCDRPAALSRLSA